MADSSLGTLRLTLVADVNNLNAGITTAKANITSLSTVINTGGQETMRLMFGLQSLGLVLGGIGATALVGIGGAVKEFGSFEEAMKNVQSIMQGSQKDFETLSQFAMDLGKNTVFSSTEAAKSLYYLASAGYTVEEQMKVATSVLDLATSAQFDLARSAEMVAVTITSFGLEASDAGRVVDVFAKSTAMGQLTMEKLSYALPMAASKANELGWSLEELTAWLGLLSDSGLKGEMSGMRVRDMLNELLNPSAKAKEALASIGIEFGRLPALLKDPQALLALFVDKAKSGLLDAAKSSQIFGDTSEGMMLAVASQLRAMDKGTDAWKKYADGLNNASGAAKQMADIQLQSLTRQFEQLKGSIENLQIKMGGTLAPTLIDVSKSFEKLVDWLSTMDKQTLKSVTELGVLGGGLASLGGIVALTGSQFISMLGILSLSTPAVVALATKLGVAGLAFVDLALVIWAAKQAYDAWNVSLDAGDIKTKAETQYLKDQESALILLKKAMELAGGQGVALGMTFGELSNAYRDNGVYLDYVNTLARTNFDENQKVSTAYVILNSNIAKNREGLGLLSGEEAKSTTSKEDLAKKAEELAKKVAEEARQAAAAAAAQTEHTKALDDLTKGASQTQEALTKLFDKTISGLGTYKEAWVANADGIMVKTREFVANEKTVTETGIQEVAIATIKGLESVKDAHLTAGSTIVANDLASKGLLINNAEVTANALKLIAQGYTKEQIDAWQQSIDFGSHMAQMAVENDTKATASGKDASIKFQQQKADEAQAGREALAILQELSAEQIEDNKKKNKSLYEDMLQFQAGELNSYKAQTQLIYLEYNDRLEKAQLFGLNEIEIEKWKNDQILQLRIQHGMEYLNLVGNFSTDIANISLDLANTLGLYNEQEYENEKAKVMAKYDLRVADAKQRFGDEKELAEALRDIEQWKNDEIDKIQSDQAEHRKEIENNALVRFAKWIDNQINLITDLKNAYLDLSSIIGAVGNLIDYLAGTSDTSLTQTGNKVSWLSGLVSKLTGGTGVGGLAEEIGTGGATAGAGASTGGWAAGAASALKAGASAVAPFILPAAGIAIAGAGIYGFAKAVYESKTQPSWESQEMARQYKEYTDKIKEQEIATKASNETMRLATNKAISSYLESKSVRPPAPTGSGLAGVEFISNIGRYDINTGLKISGAGPATYAEKIASSQTTSGMGGYDSTQFLSSIGKLNDAINKMEPTDNRILAGIYSDTGEISTYLFENLRAIKENTSKDFDMSGLVGELKDSNDLMRKNIVNALDFSKMENYLSIIASNTEVSKVSNSFSDANMDSLADAIMRSYQRRGVLTQPRI